MTNTYQVGAEVGYGCFHQGTPINYGFSRVVNVNRHGHVKLENGMVFDKFGHDRCDYGSRLMQPEVLHNWLNAQKKKQERTEKINRIQNLANMLHYNYNDNLAETKQQMIELINSL